MTFLLPVIVHQPERLAVNQSPDMLPFQKVAGKAKRERTRRRDPALLGGARHDLPPLRGLRRDLPGDDYHESQSAAGDDGAAEFGTATEEDAERVGERLAE